MSHYFENDDTLKSDEKLIKYFYKDKVYSFYTDLGVFSKNAFDFGSNVLVNALTPQKNTKLLDVGCGYGAMSIVLADYYNCKCDLIDINTRAMKLANKNIEMNNVKNTNVFYSNIYSEVKDEYDVIISNPPIRAGKHVVHEVISGAINYLKLNAYLVIVIQKKQGAPSALKKMEEVYGNCEVIAKEKGYFVLKSIKTY